MATICQVLHSLRIGGGEILAARLARRLSGAYDFVFLCLDEEGTLGAGLRRDGFRVEVLGRRPGIDWMSMVRMGRFLRRKTVDLVHAHQYTPFVYSGTARYTYRRPPIIFTEHGRHFPDYPRHKRILANRLLLEKRDRVTAVGASVKNALVQNEGIPANRIDVIYNGIDLSPFQSMTSVHPTFRSELGIRDDDYLLVQVARLDYLKDHMTALRAMTRILSQSRKVHLAMVGEGPEETRIRQFVQDKELATKVHVLGLRLDVPRLLQAANAFLLTSVSEGIPLTIIEAMAAGLPVISTNVGGLGEVVRNGLTGLLTEPGDDAGLADAVLRLMGEASAGREMGRKGKESAFRQFSEERMVSEYARLYNEMLKDQRM